MKNISYNEETTLIFEKGVGEMLFWKDEETGKTKKVTAKDLQDNIMKIRMTMNWVEEERAKTIEVMKLVDKNSETGIEKYKVLHGQLKELNEMLDSLQSQEEKQYVILKKYNGIGDLYHRAGSGEPEDYKTGKFHIETVSNAYLKKDFY